MVDKSQQKKRYHIHEQLKKIKKKYDGLYIVLLKFLFTCFMSQYKGWQASVREEFCIIMAV